MDDIQKALITLVDEVPDSLMNRQKLRAALMDLLPEKKLQVNLLMNAYDEGVVTRLTGDSDTTLHALQLIKSLADGYGLTRNAALWSISSWCYILKLENIALALDGLQLTDAGSFTGQDTNSTQKYRESFDLKATYRAGADFPAGDLRIELDGKMQKGECTVSISKSPKRLRDLAGTWFNSQVYVKVKDGDYLAVFPWNYFGWEMDFSTYRIIKVE